MNLINMSKIEMNFWISVTATFPYKIYFILIIMIVRDREVGHEHVWLLLTSNVLTERPARSSLPRLWLWPTTNLKVNRLYKSAFQNHGVLNRAATQLWFWKVFIRRKCLPLRVRDGIDHPISPFWCYYILIQVPNPRISWTLQIT